MWPIRGVISSGGKLADHGEGDVEFRHFISIIKLPEGIDDCLVSWGVSKLGPIGIRKENVAELFRPQENRLVGHVLRNLQAISSAMLRRYCGREEMLLLDMIPRTAKRNGG